MRRVGLLFGVFALFGLRAVAQVASVSGRVLAGQHQAVAGGAVEVVSGSRGRTRRARRATTDGAGRFEIDGLAIGAYRLTVIAAGFQSVAKSITVEAGKNEIEIELATPITRRDSVAVTADVNEVDVLSPDPAEKVFVKQDLLDANPGRPGAPVSIPGYPIETASSGIKAPQYFAPGVAGDHGEPIAQYLAVGSYLVPNNLSANAHGNGYADPNIFIPETIESVQVDGGAFNVRQGNHALNLAAVYGLRSRVDDPFVTVTGDYRDVDVVGGFSPASTLGARSFVAVEGSYGNGFLKRLEHRQQYKLNGQRVFELGRHELTLLGIAYYGSSYVPGLVPVFAFNADDAGFANLGDTIDPRQKDQTHTALAAANDVWRLTGRQQLQVSGFFRTYNLALDSDFGQGLIRQSEFRTVAGQSTNYVSRFGEAFSLLAGLDYELEAPRRDNLDRYGFYTPGRFVYGPFTKVDSNDVTITSVTPYAAGSGTLGRVFRYYAGWRRDEVEVNNRDLINPTNSFHKWVGVNSPKATIAFVPRQGYLPEISGSFGQAFFTEDPRIGTGAAVGTAVATAHSYQLVASKTVPGGSFGQTDFKVTLGHVTTSQELGKIDPDTGLQQDQGPGRLKFLTAAVRHNFTAGSLLVTFSKADARDVNSGGPTPEAPRTLLDLLGSVQRLPLRLQARAEFEYMGRKPLGTGCKPDLSAQCVGTSVREFRLAMVRPFLAERLNVGVNALVASGYTGQTIESFYPSELQEVVGVRIPSYASLSVTYRFGRRAAP